MPITPGLLDELLKDYKSPDDMFGEDGLLQQLTKAVVERALQGKMTHHLGYEKHDSAGKQTTNSRNGKSKKTKKGRRGRVEISVPRARASEFEPQLIRKGQTRFDGFDDKSISMYARGMTCRDIPAHLQEIYGVEVSPDLISTVTDGVIDEVRTWQSRPLAPPSIPSFKAIFPQTQVQLCLVHLMRFSLAYVSFKDRKAVAADLKAIYRATSAEEVEHLLDLFAEK